MAYTMQSLMQGAMSNPDVLVLGLLAGFLLSKAMNRRNRNSFGGGGMF